MPSDLRNALRAFLAAPGFTLVALAVLTLGIGATAAIFSMVDAVVLRGLPFDEADRLVAVSETDLRNRGAAMQVAPQNFADWKAQQDVFEGLAATTSGSFTIREGGHLEELPALRVTANLFSLVRVSPRLGRGFTEQNEIDGNHRVMVLSDGLWRRRFGADPNIIGKTMTFETGAWEIVGVMPPGFTYPIGMTRSMDLWVPYVVPEREKARGRSRGYYLKVVGRLKPGVTLGQARARMDQISASLSQQFPLWFTDRGVPLIGVSVMTLHESIVGSVRSWMLLLLGAVAFVLLIACVNVANLMLARATSRAREMGIRTVLGATRWQVVRGFLVESLVLSITGTLCGLVLAWWGVEMLRASLPPVLPRVSSVAINLRVLGAAAIAAVVTGIAFGLVPALQISRLDPVRSLREGGHSGTASKARQRVRSALVVAEVSLAVMLLVGAGLFVSSFVRLMRIDLGFDYHNVLELSIYPRIDFNDKKAREAGYARAAALIPTLLERIRQIPGVEAASAIAGSGLPLTPSKVSYGVKVPGRGQEFTGDDTVDVLRVSPDYIKAVRLPLLRGRFLSETDTATTEPVVVLSDFAARKYFEGREALGQTVEIDGKRTIVGIAASTRRMGPEAETRPEAYLPIAQQRISGANLIVRTSRRAEDLIPAIKAAVWSVLPDYAIPDAQTFEQNLGRLIAQRRFNMLLISLFGILGVVIAAVGVYGVMAYTVAQRTQEIGVRMALGALPSQILRMVLSRASAYVALGLALGLAGAWVLARFVQTFLFRVEPHDPVVYALVALTLVGVGLLAAFVPARRASKVDPLISLRAE